MLKNRILSTYLTYKFELNMFVSIMHRVTGILLYILILISILYFYMFSIYNVNIFYYIYNIILFKIFFLENNFNLIIFLILISLFYHMMTGIRHYIWEEKLMLGKTIINKVNISLMSVFILTSLVILVILY
jgi:succinate dehydrogenase cytochrome b subunit